MQNTKASRKVQYLTKDMKSTSKLLAETAGEGVTNQLFDEAMAQIAVYADIIMQILSHRLAGKLIQDEKFLEAFTGQNLRECFDDKEYMDAMADALKERGLNPEHPVTVRMLTELGNTLENALDREKVDFGSSETAPVIE